MRKEQAKSDKRYECMPEGCWRPLQKFILIHDGAMSEPYTIQDLIVMRPTLYPDSIAIQCLGLQDARKQDLYEGDILKLTVTEDLMNPKKNTFYNSNLGKAVAQDREITAVLCALQYEKTVAGCQYIVYFEKNKTYVQKGHGADCIFLQYLVSKGAVRMGNMITDPDLLNTK